MSGFPPEKFYLSRTDVESMINEFYGIRWDISAKLVRLVMKEAVKYYLRFSDDDIARLPKAKDSHSYMLYMHVPFCMTLCPYCSFHRFKFHEETARRYFSLLRDEMRMTANLGYNFGSVYFGGGTTSILPDELAKTIDLAHELFDIKEVSCESDPNHIDPVSMEYTVGRIDRMSVGIQSFSDRHLADIGRMQKFGTGDEQFDKVKRIIEHFPIVNIDLIYNFPGQTEDELTYDIDRVRELSPQQATFYPLMYAPFAGKKLQETLGRSGYDTEAAFYRLITGKMKDPYIQRTSWTYAKKTTECIDEYVVDHSEYVGLGSGAFSFLDGTLYANSFSLKEYGRMIAAGRSSAVKSVGFGRHAIKQYRMMVEMFGLNPVPFHRPYLEYNALRLLGAVRGINGQTALTDKGLFMLSVMMKCFYNGMDYIREVMRKDLKPEDERIDV